MSPTYKWIFCYFAKIIHSVIKVITVDVEYLTLQQSRNSFKSQRYLKNAKTEYGILLLVSAYRPEK